MNVISNKATDKNIYHIILDANKEQHLIDQITEWIYSNSIRRASGLLLHSKQLKCLSVYLTPEQKIEFELAFR